MASLHQYRSVSNSNFGFENIAPRRYKFNRYWKLHAFMILSLGFFITIAVLRIEQVKALQLTNTATATIEQLVDGVYRPKFSTFKWFKDDSFIVYGPSKIDKYELGNYEHKEILFNVDKIYRHSKISNYYIEDLNSHSEIARLYNIQNIQFANSESHLAYVSKNDISLILNSDFSNEIRITFDGSDDIFNGVLDWVYEEEVFQSDNSIWWSPNDEYIAFLKLNDTLTPIYDISLYSDTTSVKRLKYPTTESHNPISSLHIYSVKEKELIDDFYTLNSDSANSGDQSSEKIIAAIKWLSETKLLVKELTRDSKSQIVYVLDVLAKSKRIVREDSGSKGFPGWIENFEIIPFERYGCLGYFDIVPSRQLNDYYYHVAMYYPYHISTPQFLTSGDWEVTELLKYSNESLKLYFTRAEKYGTSRALKYVDLNSLEVKPVEMKRPDGYHSVSLSPNSMFMYVRYEGPRVPISYLSKFGDSTNNFFLIDLNLNLTKAISRIEYPTVSFERFTLPRGDVLNAKILYPPNFDRYRKYPVLFHPYGGPSSQRVSKQFKVDLDFILASNRIVVILDGAGTGFQGNLLRSRIFKNLGTADADDQIYVAEQLSKRPYVDSQKIGIWGWSYGGYLTLKCLEKSAGNVFKHGLSVAPVSDWRLYDSIYTERYMDRLENNRDGYDLAKVSNMTSFSRLDRFAIFHGTADDNVHIENSFKFILDLTSAEVQNYDMRLFINSDHSIANGHSLKVLYQYIDDWLQNFMG